MKINKSNMKLESFEAKRKEFIETVTNGATDETQNEKYLEMVNAMADDIMLQAEKVATNKVTELGNIQATGLTADEYKFFNAINTEVGYKEETLLPITTTDKIFDDIRTAFPLLSEIGLKTAGLRLRVIKSERTGQVVWGKIFGEIKGQLDATFNELEITQSKATCFVVIPNDLLDYGPNYIERFVRLQIVEAFGLALEAKFITGDGNDKPIGLNRQVQEGVSVSGGVYPEKTVTGTITFKDSQTTVRELSGIMKELSTKENGKTVNVSGKVVLLVNPVDAWDIKAQYTSLNANGVYVTSLPFNVRVVESEFVEAGKLIAFVNDRYDAYVGGGVNIKKFEQTLAMEDCTLFTAKQFAYGKAEDDNVAKVYTIDTSVVPAV